MNRTNRAKLLAVVTLFLTSVVLASETEVPPDPEFVAESIRSGVEQSPARYLAAVLERTGPTVCDDAAEPPTCSAEAKIVEVFASRGDGFKVGNIVRLHGHSGGGDPIVAFLVPFEGSPDVLGASCLFLDAAPSTRDLFVAGIRKAGL